jgi:hypothetical protein
MSQPNEEQKRENRIAINEAGELAIQDPELSEAVAELSDEELDEIAGGRADINGIACKTTNSSMCACAPPTSNIIE